MYQLFYLCWCLVFHDRLRRLPHVILADRKPSRTGAGGLAKGLDDLQSGVVGLFTVLVGVNLITDGASGNMNDGRQVQGFT